VFRHQYRARSGPGDNARPRARSQLLATPGAMAHDVMPWPIPRRRMRRGVAAAAAHQGLQTALWSDRQTTMRWALSSCTSSSCLPVWVGGPSIANSKDLQATCAFVARWIRRQPQPFCQAVRRPGRRTTKPAKIPSCALPTPPHMQLRRNRDFVSNPALLHRHLFLCLPYQGFALV
jgi:hypothetical protein